MKPFFQQPNGENQRPVRSLCATLDVDSQAVHLPNPRHCEEPDGVGVFGRVEW